MSSVNIPDLVSEFHTLEGIYFVQKQQSFGRYFAKLKGLLRTKEDQLSFMKCIVPQTRTEEIFVVQMILHYQCIAELWNILFNEDLQLMAKIFRAKWFFKEGFVDITPEILVTTVFPKVSYLLRLRILNKLNRYLGDEMKSNLYFEAVEVHYGLMQASILLPSCSEKFILSKINSHGLKLKQHDLVKVYRRYPTFPERYFSFLKENGQVISDYSALMKYLVLHDTNKYWQLKHNYELCLALNRKQTTQVMKLYKPQIIQNLRFYTPELNKKALMAHINPFEFNFFLKEIFPLKSEHFSATLINDFDSPIFKYLQKIDKSLWLSLIEQTYHSAYNENLRDVQSLITPAILQLMPLDERSKFAEMKMAKDNNEKWICYYATEKAIGIIKSKINLTAQIPQRSQYIKMLVTTCKINNDKAALLEVIKYFVNRHKNDDVQLKRDFLSSVQQLFEIEKLSLDHINAILDIIKLFNLKHGSWFWGMSGVLAKIVLHHIDNNLPIREGLISYFKVERRRDIIDLFNKSPRQTKCVLLAIAEMIEDLSIAVHAENEDKWAFYACYVNSLIKWNSDNKNDQILLSQFRFINEFFKDISGNNVYDSSLVRYIKATNYDQELQKVLCDTYWKSIGSNKRIAFYCSETDSWFAKYKPHYIFDNAEIIFSDIFNCHNFQKFIRHTDISEKFAEKALEIFSNLTNAIKIPENDVYKYKKAILILANNPQFVNLVQSYFPLESGIVNPDDDSTIHALRLTIVQALESIRKPSTTLETLLLFLKADYLHSSLSTLYKITQNTPMCHLSNFLHTLSNRAVSVRKHAIYLNATLMDTAAIYDMLSKTGEKENNPSLRKFILKRTLKYFLENGKDNENFWHLLKMQMFLLNSDDVEGHKQLLVLNKIPLKYQPEYVVVLFQLFSVSKNKTVNNLRFDFLGSIHKKLFPNLSNMFCDEVIKISLLARKSECLLSYETYEFIFNTFLYGDPTQISMRMECVFELFRDLLKDSQEKDGAAREIVQDFILKCCTYLITKRKDEPYAALVNILEILRLKWSANFTCLVAFHQFLILNFTALYFECSRTQFESVMFVQRLGTMFDDTAASFGESIIELFSNIARQFLRIICAAEELNNDECILHTLRALSMNLTQTSRLILVINSLPVQMAKTTVLRSLHLSILDTLRLTTNDTAQLHLNNYLTKLKYS